MISIEGKIVNIDKVFRGRVEVGDNGVITTVGEETGKADLVLKDELIFPGFVDLHVHARECVDHSQDYKEDFKSAGEAAINGGVVAFADMPNNPIAPVDDQSYAAKQELIKKSAVEVLLYAGIGKITKPLEQKVPYKVYIGKSVGNLFFEDFESLENVLSQYRGQNVSFHCEDPIILKEKQNAESHEQKRPPQAEINAVDFALKMIAKYNLVGKICHCSTVEALEKIITAKKQGVNVSVEITPHHLFFDQTMITKENSIFFQVNPPIRQTQENRLALIAALKNGDIDFLATDHAPHSLEEKQKGASGLTHLDTYGSFVTWLMVEHQFSPSDILRVCAGSPGKFVNQFSNYQYGKIESGFVGSFTIIDTKKPWLVEKSQLKTKAGWSPFEGVKFPGRASYTIVKGKIYQN